MAIGSGALMFSAVATANVTATGPAASELNRPGIAHVLAAKEQGAASLLKLRSNNMTYHGGVNGSGVVTGADQVYIVEWGWTSDPSGEAARQQAFFKGVGGSSWNNSVTQYCQGVSYGSTSCPSNATHAVNPVGVYNDANLWIDNTNPVPATIGQGDLANEAVRAAAHFGNTSSASNTVSQYIIDTPKGHSTPGFGTQFCAWHSSTTSAYGNIAYTNFPYITDAGSSCGKNFVNSGAAGNLDGVTIVGGHEFAETESDIYPNGGWLDRSGGENGDKCAWISSGQGASTNITLSTGTFAVQSLWSNAFNGGRGGCVNSY